MRTIKFRGKRTDTEEWVYGYYYKNDEDDLHRITKSTIIMQYGYIVIPETVGQLRYTSPKGVEYYDGDIYYHAGHGEEVVSDMCELQMSIMTGNSYDIGEIISNIHTKKNNNAK